MINSVSLIYHSIVTTKKFSCRNHYKINICSKYSKRKPFIHSVQFDKFYPKVKGIITRFSINRIIPALKKKINSLFINKRRKKLSPKLIKLKFINNVETEGKIVVNYLDGRKRIIRKNEGL